MKKISTKIILGLCTMALLLSSCADELDTKPKVELSLENLLAKDPNAVQGLLSKMYGTLALSGSAGPGSSDISGADVGETSFLRGMINLQDFTADAMKNRWGDDGLDQLTTTSRWTSSNKFFRYMYDRIYYIVPQTTNIILALENVDVADKEQITSELRFIRAFSYYYMIDCFGKGVLVTNETYGTSSPLPEASRQELFDYVESELLDIEGKIAVSNEYGRANKAVVRMLLAKLYLNAQVYTGTPRWDDALTYTNKVIGEGGYQLADNFVSIFSADNNVPTNGKNEIIFPLIADAVVSQSFGNTTYLVNGSCGSETMNINDFGTGDGWSGHRATKAWYSLFGDLETSPDDRAKLFWTEGHSYEMTNYKTWTDGYPAVKFRNNSFNGTTTVTNFSSTDFPLYRLSDAYLMYAELTLRGASGGSVSQALEYVNMVRGRSHAELVETGDITLDFILDERARELNFEGQRRMDLIRFGKFTGSSYIWPWKGNTVDGTSIPDTYRLFPIPLTAIQSNPNLTQNPGF
jgi:hypothetical protein